MSRNYWGSPVVFMKFLVVFLISLRLSLVPHQLFKDRDNYIFRIENSKALFLDMFEDSTPIFLNEPAFAALNYFFSSFLESEFLLSFYVFLNCFFVIFYVLFARKSVVHSFLALALLFMIPYFYGASLGAVRQGLGFNFLLISLMKKDDIRSNSFLFFTLIASLFHVVFYVFLTLVLIYRFFNRVGVRENYALVYVFLGVFLIGGSWYFVTPYLSETQSYEDFESATSGVTFLGWLCIFIIFYFNYFLLKVKCAVRYDADYILCLVMFACFLVFYWVAPGPYRILYSCAPILVVSIIINFNFYAAISYISLFLYSAVLMSLGAGAGSMTVTFESFMRVLVFGVE